MKDGIVQKKKKLNHLQVERLVALRKKGYSLMKLGEVFGIDHTSVMYWLRKARIGRVTVTVRHHADPRELAAKRGLEKKNAEHLKDFLLPIERVYDKLLILKRHRQSCPRVAYENRDRCITCGIKITRFTRNLATQPSESRHPETSATY